MNGHGYSCCSCGGHIVCHVCILFQREWQAVLWVWAKVWCVCKASVCDCGEFSRGGLRPRWDVGFTWPGITRYQMGDKHSSGRTKQDFNQSTFRALDYKGFLVGIANHILVSCLSWRDLKGGLYLTLRSNVSASPCNLTLITFF